MAEAPSSVVLLRLMSWLSPAFPVGAFAYSHGLEQAIHEGFVSDRGTLTAWLTDLVVLGSGWNDTVLLAEAWRTAELDGGAYVAELAEVMAASRERHMETTLQGAAFNEAVGPWGTAGRSAPYPVAIGLATARNGIGLEIALAAHLHAFVSNLVQASVRLVPLGQRDGVATLASLEPVIAATAARATSSTLDHLGSCTLMSDIMSMQHETLYSRVFRS